MTKLLCYLIMITFPSISLGQDVDVGRALFERHCANCHGMDARGTGPMAPILLLEPSDLTQLTNKGKGVFPRSGLIAKIDGRDPIISHGSPMPIFGRYFEGKGVAMRGEDGILIMTSQPIVDLVTYLEAMQDEPQ